MATVQPTSTLASTTQPQATAALASPYDGTTPSVLGNTGSLGAVPTLTGLGSNGSSPQVNATNQTALAPNGNVNQTVTNSNQYSNKFYNIVVPSGYGAYGSAWNGLGSMLGSWNQSGNAFVDPQTGVLYVQKETGIVGWFKRLFRGY